MAREHAARRLLRKELGRRLTWSDARAAVKCVDLCRTTVTPARAALGAPTRCAAEFGASKGANHRIRCSSIRTAAGRGRLRVGSMSGTVAGETIRNSGDASQELDHVCRLLVAERVARHRVAQGRATGLDAIANRGDDLGVRP